jgi:uncharacterized protein YoxC
VAKEKSMYLQIGLVILGVAFFLLIIFCIPVMLEIRQAAKNVTVTLETLNQRLPSILKNIEEITTNINSSTSAVNREVQNFTYAAERFNLVVKNAVDDLQDIAPVVLQSPAFQTAKKVLAVVKGIGVFLNVFLAKK